jgi:hypothetical protein
MLRLLVLAWTPWPGRLVVMLCKSICRDVGVRHAYKFTVTAPQAGSGISRICLGQPTCRMYTEGLARMRMRSIGSNSLSVTLLRCRALHAGRMLTRQ